MANHKTTKPTGRKETPRSNRNKSASPSPRASRETDGVGGSSVSRRGFIRGVGVAAGGASVVEGAGRHARSAPAATRKMGPSKVKIFLDVDGKKRAVAVEPRVTLLRALRNQLDVTGPKEVCDRGACGACTVIMDGEIVNACMTLAVDAVGKKIETVESLAVGDKLHPLQEAFCEFDALQCGFCTPGFVTAGKNLLDRCKGRRLELAEVKTELAGNICRCGTYNRVFAAVQKVANDKA